MSSTYKQLGEQIGALVDEKRIAYGDSTSKVAACLRILYDGDVPADQIEIAALVIRDLDKTARIVANNDPFGESPWLDKVGYAMIGARLHEERKAKNGCGSAKEHDAEGQSTGQSGSAGQCAPRPITTSAEPRTEPSLPPLSRPQPSDSSNATDAPAAVRSRRVNAAGLVASALACNLLDECPMCPQPKSDWASIAGAQPIYFCSSDHRDAFLRKVNA